MRADEALELGVSVSPRCQEVRRSAVRESPTIMRVAFTLTAAASASALVLPRACTPRMSAPLTGEDELLAKFGLPTFEEPKTDRRTALGLLAGAAVATGMTPPAYAQDGMFSLPPLPYAYDAVRHRNPRTPRASFRVNLRLASFFHVRNLFCLLTRCARISHLAHARSSSRTSTRRR